MHIVQGEFKLNDSEIAEIKAVFDSFDTDKSGSIDEKELTQALKTLKLYQSAKQVQELLAEVDKDKNGTIEVS